MSASNSVATVRAQYEDLPYPPVDPQDELRDLKSTFADYPARVNHYGWGGKRDFSKGFRILVAGGGTGNSAIYMAEHYCPMGAEIVYIDLSSASIKIAKKRAELRKIDTIRFLQGSLLDLPTLKLGKFDYIECSGVLHHLPNPALGLHALTEMLAADGVLNLMVVWQDWSYRHLSYAACLGGCFGRRRRSWRKGEGRTANRQPFALLRLVST